MPKAKTALAADPDAAGLNASSASRLVEAAEVLFGRHGLDGVSLRQIGAAAGSSNNYAVQYHFGNIDGLIEAILLKRIPVVDARQDELLAAASRDGCDDDTRVLLEIFLRPLLEQKNSAGDRSYARFICALLNAAEGMRHCRTLFHLTPATSRILEKLHEANPALPHHVSQERLRLLSVMVCTSVFNRLGTSAGGKADDIAVQDALDVAAAGLAAPYRDQGD